MMLFEFLGLLCLQGLKIGGEQRLHDGCAKEKTSLCVKSSCEDKACNGVAIYVDEVAALGFIAVGDGGLRERLVVAAYAGTKLKGKVVVVEEEEERKGGEGRKLSISEFQFTHGIKRDTLTKYYSYIKEKDENEAKFGRWTKPKNA
ncbi:hypothetical protein V8G54_011290 [Vigna mungo]|uniref:Uncharacterized protein n=1 Tax=Vigna mungo TaxID=3915 RepID=A0AAQ3NNV2_VIGMU